MSWDKKICPFITRFPDETECFEKRCMAWGVINGKDIAENDIDGIEIIPNNGCKLIEKP